ncbi:MAG: TlpA disulfide reductase family protein [Xanthomonadales bacterium]|jgi:thiol-disulfide isomerase/thioredoxin|nr:TlpA disulfide reductase family protein [Xanthomonadales bacterium]
MAIRIELILGFLLFLLLSAPAAPAAEVGTPVPENLVLERLGEGSVSLSEHRGRWVVVNYWATWCAPCVKEMPELSELHSQRGDVVVLGLAFEDVDDADFYAFLEKTPVEFPILKVDVYNPPQPFGTPKVLPTTYVVDPAGIIQKVFMGPVTREDIEHVIDG